MAVETGSQALDELRLNQSILIVGLDLTGLDCWQLLRTTVGAFCSATLPVIVTGDARLAGVAGPMALDGGAYFLAENNLDALSQVIARMFERTTSTNVRADCGGRRKNGAHDGKRLSDRFQVELARTGAEALRAWDNRRHPIDLLDLVLPDMRGETVIRRRRTTILRRWWWLLQRLASKPRIGRLWRLAQWIF